jgi:hypothetical protein
MKTLFIGGPNDGVRMALPPNSGPTFNVVEMGANVFESRFMDLKSTIDFKHHTYYAKQFQNGLKIMMHENVSDPIAALIKGYHSHRKPRRKY